MNYKQIETSREIRLWITGIIGPVVIGVATIFAHNPELLKDAQAYVKKRVKAFKGTEEKETL